MKKFIRENRGQAMVELALVLPILILLLLGIMEFGRIFAGNLELQNAARDGVRYAAIHIQEVKDPDIIAWKNDSLTPWVNGRLLLLDSSKVNITFNKNESADKKDVWVTVLLRYPLEITTPVISSIIGSPVNLRAQMIMRSE